MGNIRVSITFFLWAFIWVNSILESLAVNDTTRQKQIQVHLDNIDDDINFDEPLRNFEVIHTPHKIEEERGGKNPNSTVLLTDGKGNGLKAIKKPKTKKAKAILRLLDVVTKMNKLNSESEILGKKEESGEDIRGEEDISTGTSGSARQSEEVIHMEKISGHGESAYHQNGEAEKESGSAITSHLLESGTGNSLSDFEKISSGKAVTFPRNVLDSIYIQVMSGSGQIEAEIDQSSTDGAISNSGYEVTFDAGDMSTQDSGSSEISGDEIEAIMSSDDVSTESSDNEHQPSHEETSASADRRDAYDPSNAIQLSGKDFTNVKRQKRSKVYELNRKEKDEKRSDKIEKTKAKSKEDQEILSTLEKGSKHAHNAKNDDIRNRRKSERNRLHQRVKTAMNKEERNKINERNTTVTKTHEKDLSLSGESGRNTDKSSLKNTDEVSSGESEANSVKSKAVITTSGEILVQRDKIKERKTESEERTTRGETKESSTKKSISPEDQQMKVYLEKATEWINTFLPLYNELQIVLPKIVQEIGVIEASLKSPEAVVTKILLKRKAGNPNYGLQNIDDIIVMRVTCHTVTQVLKMKDLLQEHLGKNIVKVKCYGVCPGEPDFGPYGYRRIHVYVVANTKVAEIQITTPYMTMWADWNHYFRYLPPISDPKTKEQVDKYAVDLGKYLLKMDQRRDKKVPKCPLFLRNTHALDILKTTGLGELEIANVHKAMGSPVSGCFWWNDLMVNQVPTSLKN